MKKVTCAILGVVSMALLISCNKGNEKVDETFKPSLDLETKCQIRVVGDYSNFEALEKEFDRFNQYYPNVALSYEKVDDYTNNLATVLEGNNKPNIFFSYAAWTAGDAKYSTIIPHMEELSDASLKMNLKCIRPGLINHDANNKVLMVPVFSRTYGTLVNNNLFKKEGINIPTTWNELLDACASFTNKGYKSPMMGYSLKDSSCLMNTIAYPSFVATLAPNPDALKKANDLDSSAGEYMRDALNKVKQLVDNKAINIEECDKITDNYTKVILRFYEGDVPMMICAGDTVSGTKKREKESEAFINNPFEYSYLPIPLTDKGGYFIDSPSIQFSVNKDCENLDMTNEFMRFLIRTEELNNMASLKRLVTPTNELSFDPVYASFGTIPADRTFSPEALGIKDPLVKQLRIASYKVGRGDLTVDQAVAQYGSL
jgi:multiple sugar transport system substrate-binding protein